MVQVTAEKRKRGIFKVNTTMNSWFDFGMGKGGNIITLASYLYASDNLPYLLTRWRSKRPMYARPTFLSLSKLPSRVLRDWRLGELNHPALLRYLSERNIDLCIARKECVELHFSHNGKNYFAIGFKNSRAVTRFVTDSSKGCMSPRTSHISDSKASQDTLAMFSRA